MIQKIELFVCGIYKPYLRNAEIIQHFGELNKK